MLYETKVPFHSNAADTDENQSLYAKNIILLLDERSLIEERTELELVREAIENWYSEEIFYDYDTNRFVTVLLI